MGESEEERTAAPESVVRREVPRSTRGLREGRPRRPREHRRGRVRPAAAMVLALVAVVVGGAVPHGLLLAAGLVMAALAMNLFDDRERRRRRGHGRDSGGLW
ncbi:DUF3040 domain-containing protein [Streptomyces sp. NPDC056528]|uniref:DUF3040 domain-containing protein n=1 Tax=Streptomyces sp. NPDC056528 TaxID=3345854 RepID=UPI0036AEDD6B